MKKITVKIDRTDEAGGPFDVTGYQTDTPGLAAWNRPKLSFDWTDSDGNVQSKRIHKTWALIHVPSGRHVASARLQKEIVDLAALLAPVCDWTQPKIAFTDLVEVAKILGENGGSL